MVDLLYGSKLFTFLSLCVTLTMFLAFLSRRLGTIYDSVDIILCAEGIPELGFG